VFLQYISIQRNTDNGLGYANKRAVRTSYAGLSEPDAEKALFDEMAGVFARACSMYHDGLETEAMRMVGSLLPDLFSRWSRVSCLDASERHNRIVSLFVEEGRKVGEPDLVNKIIFARMNSREAMRRTACEYLSGGGLVGKISMVESGR
jgi:hypothetical protein